MPPRNERRRYPRGAGAQPIGDIVSDLITRHGYGNLQENGAIEQAWQQAAGDHFAAHSRAGENRRGVLEIVVRNSAVLQELTFIKAQLKTSLVGLLPDQTITDLRFRVGAVD